LFIYPSGRNSSKGIDRVEAGQSVLKDNHHYLHLNVNDRLVPLHRNTALLGGPDGVKRNVVEVTIIVVPDRTIRATEQHEVLFATSHWPIAIRLLKSRELETEIPRFYYS
jgi:hypothetical protein